MRNNVGAIVRLSVLVCSVGLLAPAAIGAVTEPYAAPQEKFCEYSASEKVYRIKPKAFMNWMIGAFKISSQCIDADGDGDDEYQEKIQLLKNGAQSAANCQKSDKDAVRDARDFLSEIMSEGGYFGSETHDVAVLFTTDKPSKVICKNMKPAQKVEPIGKPLFLSDVKVGKSQLKLRKDQNLIELPANDPRAKAAEFSVADDGLKNKTSYNVAATLGLDSGSVTLPGTSLNYRVIPYIKWEQNFVSPEAKTDNEVNKLAGGMVTVLRYAPADLPLVSKLSFDPQYVTDSEADVDIGAMTVRWEPTFILDYVNGRTLEVPGPERVICDSFVFWWSVAGVVRGGNVFDDGNDPNLRLTKNFLYWGPALAVTLAGLEGSYFEPLSLNINYHYLSREKGQFEHLSQFTAELAYTLAKDANVQLKLSYDRGRDLEKFDDRDLWKTSLGYKF